MIKTYLGFALPGCFDFVILLLIEFETAASIPAAMALHQTSLTLGTKSICKGLKILRHYCFALLECFHQVRRVAVFIRTDESDGCALVAGSAGTANSASD